MDSSRPVSARFISSRLAVLAALIAMSTGCALTTVAEPQPDGEPVELRVSIPADPSAGDAEVLPPPLTAEETRALRASFSWESMTPLRELDSAGRPILHYALVYVTSRDAHESLAQLDLHHAYLPLFESERARYHGMTGIFTHEGDGVGVFAFAFLPAALINEERRLALAGEPAFDAILVREVPDSAARGADGGVSYDWLRSEHFLYNGRAFVPRATGDDNVGGARAELLGGLFRRIASAVTNLGEAIVEGVRQGIGVLDRAANGSVRLRIAVTPLNTDVSFVGGSPMLQGWGARRGDVLRIDQQPVHVSQGVSLFVTNTDAAGTARVDVVDGSNADVCVETESPAGFVTRFLVPMSLCGIGVLPTATSATVNTLILTPEMNVLAQLDDSRSYVREIHGYTVSQPQVAVGGAADIVTSVNGGRAFAPCFSLPPIPPGDIVGLIPSLLPIVSGLSTLAEAAIDFDILIPTGDSLRSRGLPTHEYGHFVMCDMLNEDSAYLSVWIPMIIEGLTQDRGDTASQLNEAFADFIASQVVGGVNYFQTEVARVPPSGNGDTVSQQWYCDPRSSVCVDDNIGGPTSAVSAPLGQVATNAELIMGSGIDPLFVQRSAKMMTTIVDAFDGQLVGGNVPGNGAAWTVAPLALLLPTTGFGAPVTDGLSLLDESVTLAAAPSFRGNGFGLPQIVRAFTDTSGGRLDVQFFRGMSAVMRSAGFTDTEICELYALHDLAGACPGGFFDTPPDIVPSAPVDLNHLLVSPNTATWSWRDISPVAGARFDFEVADATGVFQSGRVAYARAQTLTRSVLPRYDTGIVFRVRTLSPSLRVSEWTEDRLWSLAEPARGLRTTGAVSGRVPLLWTGVRATEYGVVVTDATGRREVARVGTPRYTLDRLDGGAIRVEIISYNREGVPSTPSAPFVLASTLAAPILYVAPSGDDTASGGPTAPLATLAAALGRAGALGVATIRVAGDAYVSPALSVSAGAVVQIGGGYVFPSWARPNPLTNVRVGTATVGPTIFRGCGAVVGNWSAGIRVGVGARLYLDQLGLTAVPTDGACTAAVELEGSALDLQSVALAVNLGAGGNCAAAVLGASVTGQALTFAARQSRISGAEKTNPGDTAAQFAAVCLAGAQSVSLEDSTLTGLSADPGATLRARSANGLVLTQANAVDVVRSVIASASSGVRGVEGGQTGVLLREFVGRARLANSLVRTGRGSDSNVAISAGGLFGTGNLSLFYVTALAGDDYDRTDALPLNHRSAPIALSGALGAVRILNSVLANGSGLGDPALQKVIAGVDRGTDRMTADPLSFEMRGTAISFPSRDPGEAEALAYCRPDGERFLGGIYDESGLNVAQFHRCYAIAAPSSYAASGNLAFSGGPGDIVGTTRPAARFDADGRPLPTAPVLPATTPGTIAIDALRAVGVDLTTEPVAVSLTLTRDLGSTVRLRAPPGAGAWVLP